MSVAYEWLVNESVAYERLWRLAFCISSVALTFWGWTYEAQLPLQFSSFCGRTDRRRLSIGRRRRLFAFLLLLLELRPMPFILPSFHGQFVCLDED